MSPLSDTSAPFPTCGAGAPNPDGQARQELVADLIARFGADSENPDFPRAQWRWEAAPRDPATPYWEWVATCIEKDAEGAFDDDFID